MLSFSYQFLAYSSQIQEGGMFVNELMYDVQKEKLRELIHQHTDFEGNHTTQVPSLILSKRIEAHEQRFGVTTPALCIIVQGEKRIRLGVESYTYGEQHFLFTAHQLPVAGAIIEASKEIPYLALKIEIKAKEINEVLNSVGNPIHHNKQAERGIVVSQLQPSLLDAVVRYVDLINHPNDVQMLAPLYKKEVIYKLLQGPFQAMLVKVATEGSASNGVEQVIQYILNHYKETIRIEELAKHVNVSSATLHRHFKDVTTMTPIQFQKQLRLQEARRLLYNSSFDATTVAYSLGYESPSQFNREYARLFGLPPGKDKVAYQRG